MFMLFLLMPAESHYHTTEWEVLVVIRCLKEVYWLILESMYNVILYTNNMAIKLVLEDSGNPKGQVVRWKY